MDISTYIGDLEVIGIATLQQNRPNPFSSSTELTFSLARSSRITLEIYNSAGQVLTTLVDGILHEGSHTYTWRADQPAGIYYYTLRSGKGSISRKMTIIK